MLQEQGVQPDIIVCRTEHEINEQVKQKIALFCNVETTSVMQSVDVETIYDVPLLMSKEGLDTEVLRKMNLLSSQEPDLTYWKEFLHKLKFPKHAVKIGLVGKYAALNDSYKSIIEAFTHAGVANECKVKLELIHSESINTENASEKLAHLDGILVAPGFGVRGIEGKIAAITYAREQNIPFLGICLGMQCAVIEFARNVIGWQDANSVEMNAETSHPVIDMMEDQKKIAGMGGTMRLGTYPCKLKTGSKVYQAYAKAEVSERHRHRYEFNNLYINDFEKAGLVATGINENQNLVEIVELSSHPWFVGVQFHPEYKSTVAKNHPLFVSFVRAAMRG
jgi:CTP synthase